MDERQKNGYIKIYYSFLDWEWYHNINTKVLFLHMLLRANWKEARFQGIVIRRGEFVSSLKSLSNETGLSVSQIRTAINNLKETGELEVKAHKNFSIYRVKNFGKYQNTREEIAFTPQTSRKPSTHPSHTYHTPFATIEEGEEREERKEGKKIYIKCTAEAVAQFELLWERYPNKRGKARVTDKDKMQLLKIGFDEMVRAIDRYKSDLERDKSWRKPQNGSTFFHSGYVDYLDKNYGVEAAPKTIITLPKEGPSEEDEEDFDWRDIPDRDFGWEE